MGCGTSSASQPESFSKLSPPRGPGNTSPAAADATALREADPAADSAGAEAEDSAELAGAYGVAIAAVKELGGVVGR